MLRAGNQSKRLLGMGTRGRKCRPSVPAAIGVEATAAVGRSAVPAVSIVRNPDLSEGRAITGAEVDTIPTTKVKCLACPSLRGAAAGGGTDPLANPTAQNPNSKVPKIDPTEGTGKNCTRHPFKSGSFLNQLCPSRRRDSQGSAYELVDSEAQWREIQERQGQQQMMMAATVRPAASSTPTTAGTNQPVPVQQATVRKATNAVNVSLSSSVNDSLLDQSDINGVETSSHVSSSRHRQHRKHHHRHHKHRYAA